MSITSNFNNLKVLSLTAPLINIGSSRWEWWMFVWRLEEVRVPWLVYRWDYENISNRNQVYPDI